MEPYLSFLINLPEEEARNFLENLGQDHPVFAQKLRQLLEVDAGNTWVLDKPLLDQLDPPVPHKGKRPETIGNYRILDTLGQGGMGTVYLAQPMDGKSSHKVAVKVLRDEHRNPLRQQYILREAAILAQLDHPNIARLLDVGITGGGKPFFVMTYIEGIPLIQYFQQKDASPRTIVKIFLKICDAVRYAHQHLIIHRDLKPENLLITPSGEPKLLDFGVAKILDMADGPDTAVTATRMLTPQYASPEQIFGESISVRTDIFSLGTMLYEFLAGEKPFSMPGKPSVKDLAMLFDKVPEKPSQRWRKHHLEGSGSRLFKSRRERHNAFPRDLDWAILKAIRREPEKRFESVTEFSEALAGILDGRVVSASRENIAYLLGRLFKRHPLVFSGFLAAMALLGLLSLRLYQQKQFAETQKARAEHMALFLSSVFDIQNLQDENGGQIPAKALLDQAVLELSQSNPDSSGMSEELWAKIGELYGKLGLNREAEKAIEKALETAKTSHLEERTPYHLIDLGNLKAGQGQLSNAEAYFQSAADTGRIDQLEGDYTARYYLGKASVFVARYEFPQAEAMFGKALASVGEGRAFYDVRSLILMSLGEFKASLGEWNAAEHHLQAAVTLAERQYGKNHPRTAQAYNNLGSFYSKKERYTQAQTYFSKSLDITGTFYGPQSAQMFHALNNLALVHKRRGLLDEAETLYLRCEAIGLRHFGAKSRRMATLWSNLAVLKSDQGHHESAESYYQKILASGLDATTMAPIRKNYGDHLYELKQYAKAETEYQFALKHHLEAYGEHNMLAASIHLGLGKCLFQRGEFQPAKDHFGRSMVIIAELYPADHLYVASTYHRMGQVCAALGEAEECLTFFQKALSIRKQKWGEHSPKLQKTLLAFEQAAQTLEREDQLAQVRAQLAGLRPKDSESASGN